MVFRNGPLTPGVAFVTGGARGLGNAIAVSFAKDGARGVALVDILDDERIDEGRREVEKYGAKCIGIRADVTKEDEVGRAITETVATFGRIDYAVNFAGIVGPLHLRSWDTPLDMLDKVLKVNTVGVWICTSLQIKAMLKQEPLEVELGRAPCRGSIVNCASVNSIMAGEGTGPYTASKHAVAGITKAVAALEARTHGIRVNAVSPGFILTALVAGLDTGVSAEEGMARWKVIDSRQGRTAVPADIGDAVVALSSSRMSLVMGHNLVVDGGFTISEN